VLQYLQFDSTDRCVWVLGVRAWDLALSDVVIVI
jgi:hypothetical protein